MVPKIISLDLKPVASVVTICFLCAFGFVIPLDADAKESRLLLHQTHRLYGVVNVEIANDGVKVCNRTTDYCFLCKAPDWDSIIYSDKRKLISKRKFADWSKSGIRTALSIMDNQALHKWPRVVVAKRKYKGMDSVLYAFPLRYENGVAADLKHGKFGEYVVSSGLPINKKVELYLQALYDLPPENGIPLKFNKYAQGNSFGLGLKYNQTESVIDILDTLSAKWDTQAVALMDTRLKTYKLVPESEIVVKNNDISDVFQTLMTDDDKKTKPVVKKHK